MTDLRMFICNLLNLFEHVDVWRIDCFKRAMLFSSVGYIHTHAFGQGSDEKDSAVRILKSQVCFAFSFKSEYGLLSLFVERYDD